MRRQSGHRSRLGAGALALVVGHLAGAFGVDAAGPALVDLLSARAVGSDQVVRGSDLRIWVAAAHPYAGKAAAGAKVEAELRLDDSPRKAKRTATTDAAGNALLVWEGLDADGHGYRGYEVSIRVRGPADERTLELGGNVVDAQGRVLLATDRRLYRPGERIEVRAQWLGTPWLGAPSDATAEVEIRDPAYARVFRDEVAVSPAGVLHTGWQIPSTATEGVYAVSLRQDDEDVATIWPQVQAYELPTMRLEATVEPEVVLPTDRPVLHVVARRADGTPVAGAAVTVRPPEYPRSELAEVTGAAGPDGVARLELDPAGLFALTEVGGWTQYADYRLEVEVADPLSGRRQRTSLALRASRERIHLHLVGALPPAPSAGAAFIAASHADGRPAEARVTVEVAPGGRRASRLYVFETDRFGLAALDLEAADLVALAATEWDGEPRLVLAAETAEGETGRLELDWIEISPESELAIVPRRSLLPRGEPLVFDLDSARPASDVVVEVFGESGLVATRRLARVDGPTPLSFPYDPRFDGVVHVRAFALDDDSPDDDEPATGTRRFLYPRGGALGLDLVPERTRARPGETVGLRLAARAGGGAAPAVGGLVALDAATLELQDAERLAAGPPLLDAALGLGGAETGLGLAGWTLESLDRSAPPERFAELESVARALLLERLWASARSLVMVRESPVGSERGEFRDYFGPQLDGWLGRLERLWRAPAWRRPAGRSDLVAMAAELGVDLEGLRDPWGSPYRFDFPRVGGRACLEIRSAGRDGRWGSFDDFEVRSVCWDYLRPLLDTLEAKLRERIESTGRADLDAAACDELAAASGLARSVDPQGGPYRLLSTVYDRRQAVCVTTLDSGGEEVEVGCVEVDALDALRRRLAALLPSDLASTEAMELALAAAGAPLSAWRDPWGGPLRLELRERRDWGERTVYVAPDSAPRVEVGTETWHELALASNGPDGEPGTRDDETVVVVYAQVESHDVEPGTALPPGQGLLAIWVVDDSAAALPGSTVSLRSLSPGSEARVGTTDAQGRLSFTLPAGDYLVRIGLEGFYEATVARIAVQAGQVTEVRGLVLEPAIEETITVTSESATSATPQAPAPRPRPSPLATPRLRRDFPETLLWLPELELRDGQAEVALPLADSVTTWVVAALAATPDGRLATAEARIAAELPFHAELDPPAVVTAGDEVEVPALVFEDAATLASGAGQSVEVDLRWGGSASSASASPAAVARLDLPVRFDLPGVAVLELAARHGEAADRQERRVTVRPFGRPRVSTEVRLVRSGERGEIELDVPGGGAELEATVVRGLGETLRAAVRGLAELPRGCAEQVTSTAWASLLLLDQAPSDEERRRALGNLEEAVLHLRRSAGADGGYGYWLSAQPDAALSAYVVSFLARAAASVEVDAESSIVPTLGWLLREQTADGGWRGSAIADPIRELRLTASIALALSEMTALSLPPEVDAAIVEEPELRHALESSRARALSYLGRQLRTSNDPYALALASLAAGAAGDRGLARRLATLLRGETERRGESARWSLRGTSPFLSWGQAGDLETTALAVRALAADAGPNDPTVAGGLLFLLRSRDGLGIWASTQTTIQVLRTLGPLLERSSAGAPADLELDGSPLAVGPAIPGLPATATAALAPGRHRLALDAAPGTASILQATLRAVVPWDGETPPPSHGLALDVRCAPLVARVGEEVRCTVAADRADADPYGMLLAEIGLPPGAEVDRAGLDAATKADPSIGSIEIRPDRVLAYLWRRPGGSRFEFRFRPRWALRAHAAPSRLWDYYNPTAEVWKKPAFFEVTPARN